MRMLRTMTAALCALLLMPTGSLRAAEGSQSLVSQSQLDSALAAKLSQDDSARESVRTLLAREDVQALAKGYGLDAARAAAAVNTLDGDELQRVAGLSAAVDQQLAGGTYVIQISLVALLLIIIIVILLVR